MSNEASRVAEQQMAQQTADDDARLLQKMKECRTAEELVALAKANDLELTMEQAQTALQKLNPAEGELSDEDLDDVFGGTGFLQYLSSILGFGGGFKKNKIVFVGDTLPDTSGSDSGLTMC